MHIRPCVAQFKNILCGIIRVWSFGGHHNQQTSFTKPLSHNFVWHLLYVHAQFLVCAGIFMWSLGLCRNIPAQSCYYVVTWPVQEYFCCTVLCLPVSVQEDMCKCYEMNTLYYVICHEIVVWNLFGFVVAKKFG